MQNILNVKEKLETQAKNEFAIAAAKEREEEEKLNAVIARRDERERSLKELASAESLDIREITEEENALEVMKYHVSQQRLNLAAARQELEVARDRLTAAMQDRKTHEKLKEKQFDQFKADEAAKESKEIDEIVSYRHGVS